MTACAIAHLRHVQMGQPIAEYLARIDATMAPFSGRYLVHGGSKTVLEECWPGDLIIIAFPDNRSARNWYASDAYQEIAKLRTENTEGDVMIIDGVPEGHRATDILPDQP